MFAADSQLQVACKTSLVLLFFFLNKKKKKFDSLPVNTLRLGRFLPLYIQKVPLQKSSSLISNFLFFGSRRRLSGLSAREDLRKRKQRNQKERVLLSDIERHFLRVTMEDIWARYDSEDVRKENREIRKKRGSSLVLKDILSRIRWRISGLSMILKTRERKKGKKKRASLSDLERHFVRVTIEDIWAQ